MYVNTVTLRITGSCLICFMNLGTFASITAADNQRQLPVVTHRRNVAKRIAMSLSSAASVCLFVTVPVCPHDNFRTIKHRMMKLGGYVHKSLARVRIWGQRSKIKVTKDEKLLSHSH